MNADREDGREKEQQRGGRGNEVINTTSSRQNYLTCILQLVHRNGEGISNGHAWLFLVFFFFFFQYFKKGNYGRERSVCV